MARRNRPRRGRDQPRHRFRSKPTDPRKQAAGVIRRLQGSRIKSVGTARNYQERLVQVAARLEVALTALTPERAVAYLRLGRGQARSRQDGRARHARKHPGQSTTGRRAETQSDRKRIMKQSTARTGWRQQCRRLARSPPRRERNPPRFFLILFVAGFSS